MNKKSPAIKALIGSIIILLPVLAGFFLLLPMQVDDSSYFEYEIERVDEEILKLQELVEEFRTEHSSLDNSTEDGIYQQEYIQANIDDILREIEALENIKEQMQSDWAESQDEMQRHTEKRMLVLVVTSVIIWALSFGLLYLIFRLKEKGYSFKGKALWQFLLLLLLFLITLFLMGEDHEIGAISFAIFTGAQLISIAIRRKDFEKEKTKDPV